MLLVRAVLVLLLLTAALFVGAPMEIALQRCRLPGRGSVARLICRGLLALLAVRIIQTGSPSNGPARLLVANHVSWLDVLALGSVEPLATLAKTEVRSWPLIGALAEAQGCIFVDRRRRRCLPAVNRQIAARLNEGRSVLVFPEGTTFDGTQRGRFLTSHLACFRQSNGALPGSAVVQPVALSYSAPHAAWVGDATLLPHIWAVLRGRPLVCTLRYGTDQVIQVGYDRKQLGRDLAQDVEKLLTLEHFAATRIHSLS